VLDVVGFIPGLGEVADGLNAAVSLLRGNYGDAALSALSVIPFADMFTKLGKYIRKGAGAFEAALEYGDETFEAGEELLDHSDEFADAGETASQEFLDKAKADWDNPTGPDFLGGEAKAYTKGPERIFNELNYKPSSGATFKANPNKTTTVLGSYKKDMKNIIDEMGNVKSTDFGPKKGGFNVLNVPDELVDPDTFWDLYNKPWLDKAISRGDDIVLATKPEGRALSYIDINTGNEMLTGYGREYYYLLDNDYVYDAFTNMMVKK
jgi:hypothetical protein